MLSQTKKASLIFIIYGKFSKLSSSIIDIPQKNIWDNNIKCDGKKKGKREI